MMSSPVDEQNPNENRYFFFFGSQNYVAQSEVLSESVNQRDWLGKLFHFYSSSLPNSVLPCFRYEREIKSLHFLKIQQEIQAAAWTQLQFHSNDYSLSIINIGRLFTSKNEFHKEKHKNTNWNVKKCYSLQQKFSRSQINCSVSNRKETK